MLQDDLTRSIGQCSYQEYKNFVDRLSLCKSGLDDLEAQLDILSVSSAQAALQVYENDLTTIQGDLTHFGVTGPAQPPDPEEEVPPRARLEAQLGIFPPDRIVAVAVRRLDGSIDAQALE